jgi:hypothetical protein
VTRSLTASTTITPRPNVTSQELVDGASVLLDIETAGYYGLDEVGSVVWTELQGGTTFGALLDALRARFDEEVPSSFEDEIGGFVAGLAERGLVDLDPA